MEDVRRGGAKTADRIILNGKNLCTKKPMAKVDHKMFGHLVVNRKVGSTAYEIELPERWDIYPVFHVSLLEADHEDPVGKPEKMIPTPDIVDNEPGYVVAEVVDGRWYQNPESRIPRSFVQYNVAWEGYGPQEKSWEPFKMFEDTGMQTL